MSDNQDQKFPGGWECLGGKYLRKGHLWTLRRTQQSQSL